MNQDEIVPQLLNVCLARGLRLSLPSFVLEIFCAQVPPPPTLATVLKIWLSVYTTCGCFYTAVLCLCATLSYLQFQNTFILPLSWKTIFFLGGPLHLLLLSWYYLPLFIPRVAVLTQTTQLMVFAPFFFVLFVSSSLVFRSFSPFRVTSVFCQTKNAPIPSAPLSLTIFQSPPFLSCLRFVGPGTPAAQHPLSHK